MTAIAVAADPNLRQIVTYAILTLGCRVNGADSLAVEAALIEHFASLPGEQ